MTSSRTFTRSTFQFTHPGRGATCSFRQTSPWMRSFNSRTPGGVRLNLKYTSHATDSFNSRTPGGVRHNGYSNSDDPKDVSIHAPREGCDVKVRRSSSTASSFNSRTPGGVRQICMPTFLIALRFQFTHPGRGATLIRSRSSLLSPMFQFTHPGRGATVHRRAVRRARTLQFTHPGRGATYAELRGHGREFVSIHAPREGCDRTAQKR